MEIRRPRGILDQTFPDTYFSMEKERRNPEDVLFTRLGLYAHLLYIRIRYSTVLVLLTKMETCGVIIQNKQIPHLGQAKIQ